MVVPDELRLDVELSLWDWLRVPVELDDREGLGDAVAVIVPVALGV